ncbi:MAG: anhydro-N-acetylmuramic acid kinase [Proteobacteria bacterium]|nr:anhydro-N-acetylmuramic acid kinase [Pseudomonadota bacterium]
MTAIGLMSGTSMDGIDAALLQTDGDTVSGFGPSLSQPYDENFRDKLRALLGRDSDHNEDATAIGEELTDRHAEAVNRLLADNGLGPSDIDVIGFHGHTVFHQPEKGITRQIGDGGRLARQTGIKVVNDFRANDVAGGGQGAPFAPLYHAALSVKFEKPLAVLNIGGVANVTWISPDGGLIAFDTGPGNALIDDWVRDREGLAMDEGGKLAHAGTVNQAVLEQLMDNPYFDLPYPKSLDREDFDVIAATGLSTADGAATLVAFTAASIDAAAHQFPALPNRWLVCGGGRHNPALMAALRGLLLQPVEPAEMAGWQGDALEAQAFAFLAVRSLNGQPLSLPGTTGVAEPMRGGVLHHPA